MLRWAEMGYKTFNMISRCTFQEKTHAMTHDYLHPDFAVQYDSACIEAHRNWQKPAHAQKLQSSEHDGIEPMLLLQPGTHLIAFPY